MGPLDVKMGDKCLRASQLHCAHLDMILYFNCVKISLAVATHKSEVSSTSTKVFGLVITKIEYKL